MGQINRFARKVVCLPILFYQFFISPLIKPCCRYYPTCSQYAISSIQYFGIIKGLWRAFCRLLRCHPWATGGYDPVVQDSNLSTKENY